MPNLTNSADFFLDASDSPVFTLLSGRYAVEVSGIFGAGFVDLQILGPDGVTYLSTLQTPFVTNGVLLIDAPRGSYKFVVITATTCFASVYPVERT